MMRVTSYDWAPPFVQGLVRDLRVRWALEEAGLPHEVRIVRFGEQRSPEHLARQPFGQIPVLEDDGVELFESGAIVLHIGERSEALLPRDPAARAHAIQWMFAALNSVEPAVAALAELDLLHAAEEWAKLRRPSLLERARGRLTALSARLGDREYLEGRFTAGDLLMTTVLRLLRHTEIVAETPNLRAYQQRCEARPAFARALAAHLDDFARHAPAR